MFVFVLFIIIDGDDDVFKKRMWKFFFPNTQKLLLSCDTFCAVLFRSIKRAIQYIYISIHINIFTISFIHSPLTFIISLSFLLYWRICVVVWLSDFVILPNGWDCFSLPFLKPHSLSPNPCKYRYVFVYLVLSCTFSFTYFA